MSFHKNNKFLSGNRKPIAVEPIDPIIKNNSLTNNSKKYSKKNCQVDTKKYDNTLNNNYDNNNYDNNKNYNNKNYNNKNYNNKNYNKNFNNNETNENIGPYAKVKNRLFKPLDDKDERTTEGQYQIIEEIDGYEISPGKIYQFDLGLERFLNEFKERIKSRKTSKQLKFNIIDNYYLYHYVYSIKDGNSTAYLETETDFKWDASKNTYTKTTMRSYDNIPKDLDSYKKYHFIVRMIRILIKSEIFEIVIPRGNKDPYNPPDDLISLLSANEDVKLLSKKLEFPENTNFIIRRCISTEKVQ